MYPHLSPHGLILKLNRQPFSELPSELVQRDREFWSGYLGPMMGAWLGFETALTEVVAFVDQVYLNQNLSGFDGDPQYIRNEIPQRSFSKLRSSIGGLYAWRAQNSQRRREGANAQGGRFCLSPGFRALPHQP